MTTPASATRAPGTANKLAITITVMLASSMYALDWTIAAVALPHMRGTFSATQDQISWVLTSYIVVSAIALPTTSWLARRLGRKRLYLFAICGFTLFSMLCAEADSLPAEIAYRIGQGACGAYLIPLSQAIMLDTYPPWQHARAMAIWGMGVMLAPVVGPTLGGYLTHSYSWRWVFYINVPIGLLAIAGAIVFLARSRPDPAAKGFDWLGFAALGVGFGSLQAMLDRGERLDWFQSGEILIEGCLVALGLYLFAVHGLMAKHPLVNLRLFRDRNYFLGVMFIFLYGLLTLAPMVLLPPFLQGLQGYPITTVGMLLAPRGLGMMLAMVLFGRLGDKYDPRIGLAFGFLGLSVSSWAMSGWTLEVGFWDVAWTGFVQGVGAGIIVAPLGMMTFATLDIRHRTEASSVWNLVRSLGSSIGVAIALAILVRMSSTSQAVLTEHINPYNKLFTSGGGLPLPGAGGLALLDLEIGRQAAMIGYVDVFYLSAIASLLAIPLVPLLRRPPPATGP